MSDKEEKPVSVTLKLQGKEIVEFGVILDTCLKASGIRHIKLVSNLHGQISEQVKKETPIKNNGQG